MQGLTGSTSTTQLPHLVLSTNTRGLASRVHNNASDWAQLKQNARFMQVMKLLFSACKPWQIVDLLKYNGIGGRWSAASLEKCCHDQPGLADHIKLIAGDLFEKPFGSDDSYLACPEAKLLFNVFDFGVGESNDKTLEKINWVKEDLGFNLNMRGEVVQMLAASAIPEDSVQQLLSQIDDKDIPCIHSFVEGLSKDLNESQTFVDVAFDDKFGEICPMGWHSSSSIAHRCGYAFRADEKSPMQQAAERALKGPFISWNGGLDIHATMKMPEPYIKMTNPFTGNETQCLAETAFLVHKLHHYYMTTCPDSDKPSIKKYAIDLLKGLGICTPNMVKFDHVGWDAKSSAVMKQIIAAKMAASPTLCLQLLATSMTKRPLAYVGKNIVWETGEFGHGKNQRGVCLTAVRDELLGLGKQAGIAGVAGTTVTTPSTTTTTTAVTAPAIAPQAQPGGMFSFTEIEIEKPAAPVTQAAGTVSFAQITKHESLSALATKYIDILVNTPTIHQVGADSPLAIGDADGSVARLVLAAMKTGHVQLKDAGAAALVRLINAESTALQPEGRNGGGLRAFRNSEGEKFRTVKEDLQILKDNIICQQGHRPLIFIGDILFDRLTIDAQITFEICEEMHKNGVVLIRGNHDLNCPLTMAGNPSTYGNSVTLTSPGKVAEIFVTAYCHQNVVYIHNGISLDNAGNFVTFLGKIRSEKVTDANSLVNQINQQKIICDDGDDLGSDDDFDFLDAANNYRPTKAQVEQVGAKVNATIVYGHNGNQDIDENSRAIAVNARRAATPDNLCVVAIAAVIVGGRA